MPTLLADGRRRTLVVRRRPSTASRSGRSTSAGNGNVCITTTTPLADGAHTLTANELAPRPTMTVTPFAFTVDTRPAARPDGAGALRVQRLGRASATASRASATSTSPAPSGPLLSIQLYNGAAGVGGAKADARRLLVRDHDAARRRRLQHHRGRSIRAGNKSALSPTRADHDRRHRARDAGRAVARPLVRHAAGRRQHDDACRRPVVTGNGGQRRLAARPSSATARQVGTATPDASRVWRYHAAVARAPARTRSR